MNWFKYNDRMNYYVPKALQDKYERDAIIRFVRLLIFEWIDDRDLPTWRWILFFFLFAFNEQQNEIARISGRFDVPIQHHGHCTTGGDENYESRRGRGCARFASTGADEIAQSFQDSPATLPASPRIARHEQGQSSSSYRFYEIKYSAAHLGYILSHFSCYNCCILMTNNNRSST